MTGLIHASRSIELILIVLMLKKLLVFMLLGVVKVSSRSWFTGVWMFGITASIRIAMDVRAVDFGRFPRDPVSSKLRTLGYKIEGVASWGLRIFAFILSTSLSNVLLSSCC